MEIIKTESAPAAIGPYSQAIKVGGLIFCSGQVALRADGTFVDGDAGEQTRQVMNNLQVVLEAAGSSFEKAVKCTVFLANIDDFALVNEVYGAYFEGEAKPARATVEVSNLPKGALVEIDCVAEV